MDVVRGPKGRSFETMSAIKLLRAVGEQIRAARMDRRLTQRELGERAGIVDKYVSEIERGTRDVPFSTLYAIVVHGLELQLDVVFRSQEQQRFATRLDEVWSRIETLPGEAQAKLADIIRSILEFTRQ